MEPVWPGWENIEYLFVFGGTFSQTQSRGQYPGKPTLQQPLGVIWPGETYNEPGQPNWVGHLVSKKQGKPLLVYSYANGTQTVQNVQLQVQRFGQTQPDLPVEEVNKYNFRGKSLFNIASAVRPSLLPRKYASSMFAIWIELNDESLNIDAASAANTGLKGILSSLYGAGARNFLLFTTMPGVRPSSANQAAVDAFTKQQRNFKSWNAAVDAQIADFKIWYSGIKVMKVDIWEFVTNMLGKAEEHGFSRADVDRSSGGRIWMDNVHVTSAVHERIAEHVLQVLSEPM